MMKNSIPVEMQKYIKKLPDNEDGEFYKSPTVLVTKEYCGEEHGNWFNFYITLNGVTMKYYSLGFNPAMTDLVIRIEKLEKMAGTVQIEVFSKILLACGLDYGRIAFSRKGNIYLCGSPSNQKNWVLNKEGVVWNKSGERSGSIEEIGDLYKYYKDYNWVFFFKTELEDFYQ